MRKLCLAGRDTRNLLACRLRHGLKIERCERQFVDQLSRSWVVFSYRRFRQVSEGEKENAGLIGCEVPGVEPTVELGVIAQFGKLAKFPNQRAMQVVNRSEERRVGKEC